MSSAIMQLAAKRDRSGSSAAVDRFLQDSRRRSCSFVNPSSDALQELAERAQRNGLLLTSCEEPNVGSVTRLERPTEETSTTGHEDVDCAQSRRIVLTRNRSCPCTQHTHEQQPQRHAAPSMTQPPPAAEQPRVTRPVWRGIYVLGGCLLYTSPSPRDLSTSRMPSSA